MAVAPGCEGRIYSCPACGQRGMTLNETFDHDKVCLVKNEGPEEQRCPKCGSVDLLFGVTEDDVEDGTFVCENCDHEQKSTDAEYLEAISRSKAFVAEIENDLEERGLIVQTHQPYATLTEAGKRVVRGVS